MTKKDDAAAWKTRLSPYESVYMEKRALMFMREWPDVSDGLRPVYERLYNARLIATPPDEQGKWRNGDCLTNLGVTLKAMIASQSINFWGLQSLLDLWPIELLMLRRDDCTCYLKLFGLDWDTPDVKTYIAAAVQREMATTTTGSFGALRVREWLMENEIALSLHVNTNPIQTATKAAVLLTMLAGLGLARADLTTALRDGSYFHGV